MKQNQSPSRPALRSLVSFTDTFDSSVKDREEKFAIDRTLARGIMENKSTIILEQHSEGSLMPDIGFTTEEEFNKIMLDYRIKYDRVKTDSLQLEQKIELHKEELARLQSEEEKLNCGRRDTKMKCKQTQEALTQQTYNVEQLLLRMDNHKAIQERLKNDILFYRKKIFDSNLELMRKQSEIKMHSNKSDRQKRLSVRCKNLLSSVQKTLNSNRQQRSHLIQNVSRVVSSKKQHFTRHREREYEIQKSLISVLSKKLPQEQEMINLLLSQKLVKKILTSKMERLMKFYQQISHSFSQIRANSTAKEAQDFVYKYLNKNSIYSELSESIVNLEPKIEALKEETKSLKAENKRLQSIKEEIAESFKQLRDLQLQQEMEIIEKLHMQLERINRLKNSWTSWALCTISMFRAVPRTEIRTKYSYLGNLVGDCLRMILKYLQNQEEKDKSISQQALEKQLEKSNMKLKDILIRNFRIKTVGNEQTHRDEDDMEYDLNSERNYLHQARKAVKKQRRKILLTQT